MMGWLLLLTSSPDGWGIELERSLFSKDMIKDDLWSEKYTNECLPA
jgi:hypothetical protein